MYNGVYHHSHLIIPDTNFDPKTIFPYLFVYLGLWPCMFFVHTIFSFQMKMRYILSLDDATYGIVFDYIAPNACAEQRDMLGITHNLLLL